MTTEFESRRAPDDALLTSLYLQAEQAQLPYEQPYDLEAGHQRFSSWLEAEAVPMREVPSPDASQPALTRRRKRSSRAPGQVPLISVASIGMISLVSITIALLIGHVQGNWPHYVLAGVVLTTIASTIPMIIEAFFRHRADIIRAKVKANVSMIKARTEADASFSRFEMRRKLLQAGIEPGRTERAMAMLTLMAINSDPDNARLLTDEVLVELLADKTGETMAVRPTEPGGVRPIR
jgi:hypothetical protein